MKEITNVEVGLISKILQERDLVALQDNRIKQSYFSGDSANVFKYITDTIISTGEVPTVRAVKRKFPNYELDTFKGEVGTEENFSFWCEEVKHKVRHNTLVETLTESSSALQTGKSEEAFEILKNNVSYLESEVTENKDIDITENIEERIAEYLDKKMNKGMRGIPTGIENLDKLLKGLEKETLTTLIAKTAIGKAIPLDTLVVTPKGKVPMREIKVNSDIIGEDGKAHKVVGVYPQGKREIMKLTFNDGTSTLCDLEHLWKFKTIDDIQRNKPYRVKSLKDILDNHSLIRSKSFNIHIPVTKAVEYSSTLQEEHLPIDPYVLGCLLGDGGFTGDRITFTNSEHDIVYKCDEKLKNNNGYLIKHKGTPSQYCFKSNNPKESKLYRAITKLELQGLKSREKFIPKIYLTSTINDRLNLLKGLMDTDGSVANNGSYIYTTFSEQLSNDLAELCRSLGYRVKQHQYLNNGDTEHSISIYTNDIIVSSEKHLKKVKTKNKDYSMMKLVKVEYYGEQECQCIMVDSEDHTFLIDDFIVTHNTWLEILIGSYAMMEGYKVLQFVTEMSEDIMRDRYEAMLFSMCYGDFNYSKFKNGTLDDELEQEFFNFLRTDLADLTPLIIATATGVMNVASSIEKYKPDIVFIDGVYLMEDDQGAKEDWLRVSHITRDLKKLAKASKIPIFINTQATKETSKQSGPDLGSIMFTQSIGHDCIVENTSVLTDDGFKMVQHLEDEVFKIDDGYNIKKARCVKATELKKPIEISYEGKIFTCSHNHKLYVYDNEVGDYVWKKAKDLELENDFLLKYKNNNINIEGYEHLIKPIGRSGFSKINIPYEATEELGRFIGYMIGDGSIRPYEKGQTTLYCGYDEDYANEAIRIVEKYFNLKGKITKQKTKFSKGEQVNVVWYSVAFSDWCRFMVEPLDYKHLRIEFCEMNYDFRLGLFTGLIQSDGSLSGELAFCTIYHPLGVNFGKLLDTLNISNKVVKKINCTRVKVKNYDTSLICGNMQFVGERLWIKDYKCVNKNNRIKQPSSYVSKIAQNVIDISTNTNNSITKRAYEARRSQSTSPVTLREFEGVVGIDNKYTFIPIEKIEFKDVEVVMYDIQVFDEDKKIITDNLVTHNSDNVIALFRDEIMINENEMMIKILKQREGSLGKVLMNWDFNIMNFDDIYAEVEGADEQLQKGIDSHVAKSNTSGTIDLDGD